MSRILLMLPILLTFFGCDGSEITIAAESVGAETSSQKEEEKKADSSSDVNPLFQLRMVEVNAITDFFIQRCGRWLMETPQDRLLHYDRGLHQECRLARMDIGRSVKEKYGDEVLDEHILDKEVHVYMRAANLAKGECMRSTRRNTEPSEDRANCSARSIIHAFAVKDHPLNVQRAE